MINIIVGSIRPCVTDFETLTDELKSAGDIPVKIIEYKSYNSEFVASFSISTFTK